jgi:hypothetical protein
MKNVTTGKQPKPPTLVVYGTEKIGKSTFAAGAPDPIFLCVEDGTNELDVARFGPIPTTLAQVNGYLDQVLKDEHEHKTLVIDTADRLEKIFVSALLKDRPTNDSGEANLSLDDIPWGKGPSAVVDGYWLPFLARLEEIRRVRGMNIVILAHSTISKFNNPSGPDYDRFEMKCSKQARQLLKEWPSALLFANYVAVITKVEKGKNAKLKGIGDSRRRVLYTERRDAFDAGNRYGLPPEIDLSWDAFWSHARGEKAETAATIIARIRARYKGTELEVRAENGIKKYASDTMRLRQVENTLAAESPNDE